MIFRFLKHKIYESTKAADDNEASSSKYQEDGPLLSAHEDYSQKASRQQSQQQQDEDYYSLKHAVTNLHSSPYPCSYHIEDIQTISADDLKPMIAKTDSISSPIPDLLISYSSTSDTLISTYDTWGNADDIPTRVPSAALDEDFPPLTRCRDCPAMGWYPDDLILDIDDDSDGSSLYDDDSVASEWSSLLMSMDDGGKPDSEDESSSQMSDSFCCKEKIHDIENKDGRILSMLS